MSQDRRDFLGSLLAAGLVMDGRTERRNVASTRSAVPIVTFRPSA